MKNRTIFLLFLIIEALIVAVTLIDSLNLTKPSHKEGAQRAYYTEVKYPSLIHQGEKTFITLTIYNKECSVDGANASFFFIFYIDEDLWLNEFNSTSYGTWQCKKESSLTRYYMITGWSDMKPAVHNLRSELYWHVGDESVLQDVVTVPITVAFFAETTNLMVFSYMAVYLITIFLLGFYIMLNERITISQLSQNIKVNILEQPHAEKGSLSKLQTNFLLNFYLSILLSWQGINILFYILSIPIKIVSYVYLMAQICYFAILALLIKRNNLSFAQLGYTLPETSHKYIICSLFFGVFYNFLIIFLPGFLTGYEIFPSPSVANILYAIFFAIIFSFISESIFRGYIQTTLMNLVSFPRALLITSIMFALYTLPLTPFNMVHLFNEIVSSFIISILLGILFYKTKTLLSPIFLHFILLTLKTLTPINSLALNYVKPLVEFVAIAFVLILLSIIVKKESLNLNLREILPEK